MSDTKGIIYILSNPAMPDIVKVGKTSHDRGYEQRIKELYTTGVPLPFECEYACIVDNYETVERRIHSAFTGNRVNPKREFFEISPSRIIDILELLNPERLDIETEYEDESEKQASIMTEKKNSRRSNFKFSEYNISTGTQLYYYYDNSIVCTVAENNKVEYQDEIISLNKLTGNVLDQRGRSKNMGSAYGYWSLDSDGEESLYDYRKRMDALNDDDDA